MNLTVEQINYSVSEKEILKDISFNLKKGEVLAILGNNGAGKTSLLEIITNIIHPVSGRVIYNDNNSISEMKARIGVLWDDISLFPMLKVKEVIKYVLSMYNIKEVPETQFSCLEINSILNSFMSKLSKGEKRKVEIFLATINNPDLLIMDEPTSSLDPLIRSKIWENVIMHKDRTIIFSTHQWEEALKYATKIIFMHKGSILNEPTSGEEVIMASVFCKKIAICNDEHIDDLDAFSYKTKANTYYLIEKDREFVFDLIKERTMKYSIMPIDLEDIYNYLIRNSK